MATDSRHTRHIGTHVGQGGTILTAWVRCTKPPLPLQHINTTRHKFAQTNLGRGPRRGAVAHVRHTVPIGYNGAPEIRPQKYPFPWIDPQTCLISWPARSMMPNGIRIRSAVFFSQCTGQTDRPRESLTTIMAATPLTRATRPRQITDDESVNAL